MKAGVQKLLASIGSDGCYALCIVELGQRGRPDREAVDIIEQGIQLGYLREDMYVIDAASLMTLSRGGHWSCTHEAAEYKPMPGDLVIERWERTTPQGKTYSHFVLYDWDPLGDSETRKHGKCVSKRVFRVAP